jgi:hypothetical protein
LQGVADIWPSEYYLAGLVKGRKKESADGARLPLPFCMKMLFRLFRAISPAGVFMISRMNAFQQQRREQQSREHYRISSACFACETFHGQQKAEIKIQNYDPTNMLHR